MPLLIESELRARARAATGLYKSAAAVLTERVRRQAELKQHDIFLSHAFDDRELVLGAALSIEDLNYTVFLDWRDDPSLDRATVSARTAEILRARMRTSRCLFYATTEHASESKWMPWELGFKDGHNTRAAILPVAAFTTESYGGQQYLGIYPYVAGGLDDNTRKQRLWVHRSNTCYVCFDSWLSGFDPTERR